MKIHCKVLLFVSVWMLSGLDGVFCEEPKELPNEDRIRGEYGDGSGDICYYYPRLYAHGEYSKLKLIIRSAREDHKPGEPIIIKFYVRNDSENEVHLKGTRTYTSFIHLWKLFHSNYDEVVKTSEGEEWIQLQKRRLPKDERYFFTGQTEGGYRYIKLLSGKEWEIDQIRLSDYFDLSKPDSYELTCFQPTLINGQYYEPPLQSNTLTFRVLEEGEEAEVVEADMNPPKGKEVFKQPKPPKNVFYWFDYQSSKKMLLDDTSTLYFHQNVKEQEGGK